MPDILPVVHVGHRMYVGRDVQIDHCYARFITIEAVIGDSLAGSMKQFLSGGGMTSLPFWLVGSDAIMPVPRDQRTPGVVVEDGLVEWARCL